MAWRCPGRPGDRARALRLDERRSAAATARRGGGRRRPARRHAGGRRAVLRRPRSSRQVLRVCLLPAALLGRRALRTDGDRDGDDRRLRGREPGDARRARSVRRRRPGAWAGAAAGVHGGDRRDRPGPRRGLGTAPARRGERPSPSGAAGPERSPQERVPGHARPRAAEPAGADPPRRRPARDRRFGGRGGTVAGGHPATDAAPHPHRRRSARHRADHARHGEDRAPADHPGRGGGGQSRDLAAAGRGAPATPGGEVAGAPLVGRRRSDPPRAGRLQPPPQRGQVHSRRRPDRARRERGRGMDRGACSRFRRGHDRRGPGQRFPRAARRPTGPRAGSDWASPWCASSSSSTVVR